MANTTRCDDNSGFVNITQSRSSWGIEVGRHRISVTRAREARTVRRLNNGVVQQTGPKLILPIAIGIAASVSAFGLAAIGASTSGPPLVHGASRYVVSVPVPTPAAKKKSRLSRNPAATNRSVALPVEATTIAQRFAGPQFDDAAEPYVAQAMRTGEFQDWLDPDGQQRFLTAGPIQIEAGKACRELALLVRGPGGSSYTKSARRCTAKYVTDAELNISNQNRAVATNILPPKVQTMPAEPGTRSSDVLTLTEEGDAP